jgi:hypothetical protein
MIIEFKLKYFNNRLFLVHNFDYKLERITNKFNRKVTYLLLHEMDEDSDNRCFTKESPINNFLTKHKLKYKIIYYKDKCYIEILFDNKADECLWFLQN